MPASAPAKPAEILPEGGNWVDPPVGVVELTVVLGEESLQPIEFHTIRLGQLSVTIRIEPGMDPNAAVQTARDWLKAQRRAEFESRMVEFLGRAEWAAETVRQLQSKRPG